MRTCIKRRAMCKVVPSHSFLSILKVIIDQAASLCDKDSVLLAILYATGVAHVAEM